MGYSWQFALMAVFIEGIIFILLTVTNLREKIIECIPMNLKYAVTAGVGLFIAYVGLQNASIVVDGALGNLHDPLVILTLVGLVLTGILVAKNKKGALLISIVAISVIGMALKLVALPQGIMSFNIPSLKPVFLQAFSVDIKEIFSLNMVIVVFTLLFVDLFDTLVKAYYEGNFDDTLDTIMVCHEKSPQDTFNIITSLCGVDVKFDNNYKYNLKKAITNHAVTQKIVKKLDCSSTNCSKDNNNKFTCQKACPFNAIMFDTNNNSTYINNDICIDCGICIDSCKNGRILDKVEFFPVIDLIKNNYINHI